MNLITTQQNNQVARLINDKDPILVAVGDHDFTTKYGPIAGPYTGCHRRRGNGRACVHAIESPPRQSLFGIEQTLQLGWQPVLVQWPNPTVAARRGDVVTVAFDCMGPVTGCMNKPTILPEQYRWSYRLYPILWSDQLEVDQTVWLGIWND